MMLEEKLDQIINDYNLASEEDRDSHRLLPLFMWRFDAEKLKEHQIPPVVRVIRLIHSSNIEEALTSKYSYVREYKLWQLDKK